MRSYRHLLGNRLPEDAAASLHVLGRRLRIGAAALLLLFGPASAGCSYRHVTPSIPEGGPYVMPMIFPLTSPRVLVAAEARGSGWEAWRSSTLPLAVSTTGELTWLERSAAERLKLAVRRDESRKVYYRGWQPFQGTTLSSIRSGNLHLREVSFAVMGGSRSAYVAGTLGPDLLWQAPLTVDRDRGVVVLGEPALPEAQAVLPLEDASSGAADVILGLDGRRLRMRLDPDQPDTLVETTGRRLGFEIQSRSGWTTRTTRWARWRSKGVFAVRRVSLDTLLLEDVDFLPAPDPGLVNLPANGVGVLGRGILNRLRYRLDRRAGRLELARRGDLVRSAATRMARWRGRLPQCDSVPGCVRVSTRQGGNSVLVSLVLEAAFDEPVKALVGYVDEHGALLPGYGPDQVRLAAGARGETVSYERLFCPGADGLLLRPPAKAVLLDVNPALGSRAAGGGPRQVDLVGEEASGAALQARIVQETRTGLLKQEIACVVGRQKEAFRRCYETLLREQPHARGEVTAVLVIGPAGRITDSRFDFSGLEDDTFRSCLGKRVRGLRFRPPTGGGSVQVTYPWIFKPAR